MNVNMEIVPVTVGPHNIYNSSVWQQPINSFDKIIYCPKYYCHKLSVLIKDKKNGHWKTLFIFMAMFFHNI